MPTFTRTPGVDGVIVVDSMIKDNDATNFGSAAKISLGQALDDRYFRLWTEWDVGSFFAEENLPPGRILTNAKITYTVDFAASAIQTGAGTVSQIVRTDVEELEIDWFEYKTGSNWTTAGAADDGTDFTSVDQEAITWGPGALPPFIMGPEMYIVLSIILPFPSFLRVLMYHYLYQVFD